MLANIKKSKRRRYIRYAIELDAFLIIEKSIPVQCIIQDFCTGGLFLELKKTKLEKTLHKNIKIQFSIYPEQNRENFEINARIIHITPTGVGAAIENMPVSVFNALKNEAKAYSTFLLNDRYRTTPTRINQENLKNSFKQMLLETLPQLLINFFESVGEDLEIANQRSEYFQTHSEFEDLMAALELNRESFISEFCTSVICHVDYISKLDQAKNDDNIIVDNSLSLIEKEDFEDWLRISAIIRKLNEQYEHQINHLTGEFGRVFGLSSIAINNPISPTVLCDQFRELILQFELNNKIKSALYNIFEKALINNFNHLYEQAEILLLKHKSSETITPHPLGKKNNYSSNNIHYNQRLSGHKKIVQNQKNQHIDIVSDKLFNETELVEQKSSQSMAKIAGKLIDFLNESIKNSTETINNDLLKNKKAPFVKTYHSEQVVTAFSQLQKNIGDERNLHFDSTALLKRLQETLESFDHSAKLISNSDIQHLEVYGKFFETIFNDIELSSEIKSYLESIHLPLLSLPLQGEDFLYSDLHPVRNILNELAILEPAVKSNQVIKNTNIKNTLDKLIARISQESNTDPDIFIEAEQELDEITKQFTKSIDIHIRRIVEAYDGLQKLETARRSIQHEIDNRIAGKAMPTIIPRLLQSGWQQLLVMAELNDEIDKDEKLKYLTVIDDLIFWLHEQESILKIQSGYIQKTLDFIEEKLGSVCPDIIQRNSIIEELTSLLLGVGHPRVRKAIKTTKILPVYPKRKSSIKLPEDNWTSQVKQLRVGDWLTILCGSEGFVPYKLVWMGTVPEIYVFVNRDGLKKLELNKNELADLLQSGAANRMENLDVPLMDRVTNLMLLKMHKKLIYNATHDQETDLLTKDEFFKQLKNEMNKLNDAHHMLCHIEVLDLRLITNICGVTGGKQLLKKLTQLMKEQLRSHDLFARLGDKSFAVLFKHCSTDQGYEISKKMVKITSDSHFQWQEKSFAIGICMGLVPFEDSCYDVHQLLQQADSACLSAKRSGHNHILMFTKDDENLKNQNKLYEWIGHIDNVFSKNRLFLRCQLIVPIRQDQKRRQHYEILLGVKDEAGNIISPDQFIPAVERCKRMPEIDQWIIKKVFNWIEQNRNDFNKMDGFSINLSGQSINSEEFLEFLNQLLESSNVPSEKITFEITETVAAENIFFTKKFINKIKQFSCKFSLDDFGSGYSSYSYLKNLNVDYLKIDGAFVKDIVNNKADIAIVKSMNEIAHSLGLKTIAEYVENKETLEILKGIGVDYAQGYGIQKPIPLEEIAIEDHLAEPFSFDDKGFWGF